MAGEGELNVSKADNAGVCVAKRKYEIKDIAKYMEEISADWTELKRKNFLLTMKKVMGNMSVAHRMVSEASQEMITLLDDIELPLWMKLADMTMRPLVLLEIPEVTVMCKEAKQISKKNPAALEPSHKNYDNNGSDKFTLLAYSMGLQNRGQSEESHRWDSLQVC